LITVGFSAHVAAPCTRVWLALADPSQLAAWHPGLRPGEGAERWPDEGATLCWRARLHGIPIEVRETSVEVVEWERLHVRLELGLFRCDATYTIAPLDDGPSRTRVGLQVQAANEVPVVGGTLDRFGVRRVATEVAAARLTALREACEARGPTPGSPAR